ncbi:MAG: CooT family nickel-binding protein [Proteobacteria bacterium]|nr:CooT family nickel-binding protein [Pseudomonadota bacterium]
MCELNAYIQEEGKKELILGNVDSMEIEDGILRSANIFGKERNIQGALKRISLRDNKIFVIKKS